MVRHSLKTTTLRTNAARRILSGSPSAAQNDIYKGGYRWFVVHPQAVQYDERGLILALHQDSQAAKPSPQLNRRQTTSYGYQSDTYVEHVSGLYRAYTNYRQARHADELSLVPAHYEFAYPMRRLCQRLGKSYDEAERLMRLIIALHDVGKLNKPGKLGRGPGRPTTLRRSGCPA